MATDLSGSKIDFFHIFHVQLFEHTDGTGVFKAAFKRQIMNLLFCKIKTKLMKAGRHLDGTEIIFHGFYAGKSSFVEVGTAGNVKDIDCKLGKALDLHHKRNVPSFPTKRQDRLREPHRRCRPVHAPAGDRPSHHRRFRSR